MNKYIIKLKKRISISDNIFSERKTNDRFKTEPQQELISERSLQLYKHINQLNPYSVHHQESNLQSKIEDICTLHKNIKPQIIKTLNYRQEDQGVFKTQISLKMSEISNQPNDRSLKERFMSEIKKIQKDLQGRQQQKFIAQSMIKKIKQDRKKNREIRNKFRQKIKHFKDKLTTHNDKLKQLLLKREVGPKKVQKVFDGSQLDRQMNAETTLHDHWLLKVNKQDYYQMVKPNSTKVINLSQINQFAKSSTHLKQSGLKVKKSFNYVSNYLVEKQKFKSNTKRFSI